MTSLASLMTAALEALRPLTGQHPELGTAFELLRDGQLEEAYLLLKAHEQVPGVFDMIGIVADAKGMAAAANPKPATPPQPSAQPAPATFQLPDEVWRAYREAQRVADELGDGDLPLSDFLDQYYEEKEAEKGGGEDDGTEDDLDDELEE